jgi:hypothetical protein
MLTKKVIDAHQDILHDKSVAKNYRQMFDYIDTISNISLTASKRDDRQLMRLVTVMLHQCLNELMSNFSVDSGWRVKCERYVPGNSIEVKSFLKDSSTWPEAYIFSKFYHVLKGLPEEQDEVINEACEHFLITIKIALEKDNEHLIEMHLMILNRLNEMSIMNKNFERIQSLSQYFREIIKILFNRKESMTLAFQSWVHFGKLAYENDIHFAYETYLYDSGSLLLDLAKDDEDSATQFFSEYIIEFWDMAIKDGGKHKDVTYKVAVKTYWQLMSDKKMKLASCLEKIYLLDRKQHRQIIIEITKYETPLHWSFSDRLLRFNYLSPVAQNLALKFNVDESEL